MTPEHTQHTSAEWSIDNTGVVWRNGKHVCVCVALKADDITATKLLVAAANRRIDRKALIDAIHEIRVRVYPVHVNPIERDVFCSEIADAVLTLFDQDVKPPQEAQREMPPEVRAMIAEAREYPRPHPGLKKRHFATALIDKLASALEHAYRGGS